MNKSTIVAIVVFAALAAAAFATLEEKPQRGITRVSFVDVDTGKIDRVVVGGDEPVELARAGDTWSVGGQRADGGAVERLLDAITRVESADVVTSNEGRFAELEVGADAGTEVQAFSGGTPVAEFIVGAATGGGSNVRVGDTVYLVKRVNKGTFQRERAQWLDRKLFADAADDATRIEVKLAGQDSYALTKDDDAWKPDDAMALPDGFRFDRNAARRLASSLMTAQATDILEEDPGDATTGLGAGADTLVFDVGSGEARTLRIGSEKEKGVVYARANTRPEVVTLSEYLAKSLRKPLMDLRDLSLMDLDVSAVKRLEIVRDGDRLVLEKDGDAWKVAESPEEAPKDFTLDPMAVVQRLAAVSSARALGAAPGDAGSGKANVDAAKQGVRVTLADDRVAALAFGNDTKFGETDAVYARGNVDDQTYVVNAFTRNNLLGGLDTFAKRAQADSPLAGLDPKALSNLPPEVRESLLKQMQQKRQQDEMMRKIMERQAKEAAK